MEPILIFAGTTEGREIIEYCSRYPVHIYGCVATEYGRECITPGENVEVLSGRMDEDTMQRLIQDKKIHLVIDATHPFAVVVTENIKNVCERADCTYIRLLRETDEKAEGVIYVESVAEAVEYLKETSGNILIATGSKELHLYTGIEDYKTRCFARVLSTAASVAGSAAKGFEGKHLLAMQGPFSELMNRASIEHVNASYFVTKETGKSGGFEEKVRAAKEMGCTLVVVGRPKEEGISMEEVKQYIKERFLC